MVAAKREKDRGTRKNSDGFQLEEDGFKLPPLKLSRLPSNGDIKPSKKSSREARRSDHSHELPFLSPRFGPMDPGKPLTERSKRETSNHKEWQITDDDLDFVPLTTTRKRLRRGEREVEGDLDLEYLKEMSKSINRREKKIQREERRQSKLNAIRMCA